MGHYDVDVGCDDCGDYLYSYLYDNERRKGPQYCSECQKKRDTPLEHFIREGEPDARP